jgi:3'-phosphoadenosine 5'-phosphosulfate sulfotransferase (PAPS reductase)/FAD synthetase
MKWRELEEEQGRDLDYKIQEALRVITDAFSIASVPALAFSGGKDSTVLLDLIRRFNPLLFAKLIVIYGNTGVEYPECVKFVRWIAAEWGFIFYEAHPGNTVEPGLKYKGQRMFFDHLVSTGKIDDVLKKDGKLTSLVALEKSCPELMPEIINQRLVWPAGTRMTYTWCTDQYGWPLLGKSWSRLDARRINIDAFLRYSESESRDVTLLAYYDILRNVKISQHCCKVLKKEPSEKVQAEHSVDLIFKGLMASESRSRAKNFLTRGYLFEGAERKYLKGKPFFHCQPMAIWTDDDVWAYIRRFQVPYASLYDMTYHSIDGGCHHVKRNGCLGCGTDFGYRDNHLFVLRQTHRRAWETIMRGGMAQQIRNLQWAMRQGQYTLFDTVETAELIDMQPCAFDDLDGMGGMAALKELVYDPEL